MDKPKGKEKESLVDKKKVPFLPHQRILSSTSLPSKLSENSLKNYTDKLQKQLTIGSQETRTKTTETKTRKEKEPFPPQHWPYVRLIIKGIHLQHLTIKAGQMFIRCFVQSQNLKVTPFIRYFYETGLVSWASVAGPNKEEPCDFYWEANVRLGEVARIQVWQKSLIGDDIFHGELSDTRTVEPRYLSYDYLTEVFWPQSIYRDADDEENYCSLYAIDSKYKNLKLQLSTYVEHPKLSVDFFVIKPRTGTKQWLKFFSKEDKKYHHFNIREEVFNEDTFHERKEEERVIEFIKQCFPRNKDDPHLAEPLPDGPLPGKKNELRWNCFFQGKRNISINRWANFLIDIQKMKSVSIQYMIDLEEKYRRPKKDTKPKGCSRRMFFKYLFDPVENCIMNPEFVKNGELTDRLCDYWIDSSNNRFPRDKKTFNSSIEQYRRALLRGCRCVGLDAYDSNIPIVYNEQSKVPFWDCMEAICKAAFITSQYPLILLLDIHCHEVCRKMIEKTIHMLSYLEKTRFYPLGEDPTNKKKFLIQTTGNLDIAQQNSLGSLQKTNVKGDKKNNAKRDEKIDAEKVDLFSRRDWQVFSIEESKGMDYINKPQADLDLENEIVSNNRKSLSQIYSKGGGDSSNFNPLPYWAAGCQLVALNYQVPGYPMWLNEGKFMRSGRSGYVLKPKWMLEPTSQKKRKESKEGNATLRVLVISGWRLPRPWGVDKISSTDLVSKPQVIVSLWTSRVIRDYYNKYKKMPPDDVPLEYHKTDPNDDPHNPIWYDKEPPKIFEFKVEEKDIDMLVFEVKDSVQETSCWGTIIQRNRTIGYYAITVSDMREGIRVVPLKGEDGAPLVTGELIVWVQLC